MEEASLFSSPMEMTVEEEGASRPRPEEEAPKWKWNLYEIWTRVHVMDKIPIFPTSARVKRAGQSRASK